MKVENGLIVEITENELFSLYLERELEDALSFYEYKQRMRETGCAVIEEK